MYENYYIAGNGMKKMFYAEIVVILSAIVLFIPILGWIVGLVGVVVGAVWSMMGLYSARPAHPNFERAFRVVIAMLVVGIVESLAGDSFLATLLSIVGNALSVALVYLVCTAASELLSGKGDEDLANRGQFLWKLNLVCMVVIILCSALTILPVIRVLAGAVTLIVEIVRLVVDVLYLIFLYKASQSLLN